MKPNEQINNMDDYYTDFNGDLSRRCHEVCQESSLHGVISCSLVNRLPDVDRL